MNQYSLLIFALAISVFRSVANDIDIKSCDDQCDHQSSDPSIEIVESSPSMSDLTPSPEIVISNRHENEKALSNLTVCYITAIYGNYERTCKPFRKQTVQADFIVFTDDPKIESNGWIVDTSPYHIYNNPHYADNTINSIKNNAHPFNIGKYYKQSFRHIPRLQHYDVVIWLDGTIEITSPTVTEWVLSTIQESKLITWIHPHRYGYLINEVFASYFEKYTDTNWRNHTQPYQDILGQYRDYIIHGYNEQYFKTLQPHNTHYGVWITCFIASFIQHETVTQFMDMWYKQTLYYTTQDQVSFPYVVQKTGLIPYTLPNELIGGGESVFNNPFFIKYDHGL